MSFSKKKKFYKEKSGTVEKIKSAKNVITEKLATKVFQVYTSIVYDSFFLELTISISISTALLLWRCIKYGLLSKYLFERK